MPLFDPRWVDLVCVACDPIFASADVGFVRQVVSEGPTGAATALLWEADPARFVARYPDSGVVESYGAEQWPDVTCIDWWVYLDAEGSRARLSVEGWNLPDLSLHLSGDGAADGGDLADVVARLLGVPSPRSG